MAEALDRVLEILRTTELYSPQLGTKDEDPHTSDLVGGLMTVSDEKEPEMQGRWHQMSSRVHVTDKLLLASVEIPAVWAN